MCAHSRTGANPRRYDKRKKTDDRDFLYSLVYLPFLRTGSYKLKLSPTFWLLNKHNENKIIFNSNHNLSLVSDKIKVFMAATQKKKKRLGRGPNSGNSAHVSCKIILSLKSKCRKNLNSQANFFYVVSLNSLRDLCQLCNVIKVYWISVRTTPTISQYFMQKLSKSSFEW